MAFKQANLKFYFGRLKILLWVFIQYLYYVAILFFVDTIYSKYTTHLKNNFNYDLILNDQLFLNEY